MRQFNEEYKEYVKEEAPELWERIEAGVDQKRMAVGHDEQKQEKSSGARVKTKVRRIDKRQRTIRFVASLVACAAALVLIIPVYHFVIDRNPYQKSEQGKKLADVTIENTEELAKGGFEQPANTQDIVSQSAEQIVMEEVEEVVEETSEISYDAGTEIAEQTNDDEGMELEGQSGEVVSAGEVAESSDNPQDAKSDDTALAWLSQETEEAVCVKITGMQYNDLQECVYTVEYPNEAGDGLVVYETWTMTAENTVEPLTVGNEYRVGLSNLDRENKVAMITQILP